MTATLTPSPAESPASLSFSGRGGEFLRLLLKGSLLQIPTFGFYRFWLITKMRRHLWANTSLSGESFEYTGTAKELLIGFLIALAVLTPVYILYFIAGLVAESVQALASIPFVIVMYVLAHFGSYRARKYRATRTVFRGIRFWVTGSGWGYAMRAIACDFANIVTLGLALPWTSAFLERYRMRRTYFGTLQGDFVGTGWQLFKRGWWLWVLVALPFIVFTVSWYVKSMLASETDAAEPSLEMARIVGGIAVISMFLALIAINPAYLAVTSRWRIEGMRFGEIALSSNLGRGALYGTFVKLIASSLGLLALLGIAAFLLYLPIAGSEGAYGQFLIDLVSGEVGAISVVVAAAVAYLVLLLAFGVIQRYFLNRGLWAVIASTITVSNLAALDQAVAAGQPASSLGEGLADALDFGGGV
jgi:uncharacterized membrane protein YjgN (DUF898 family)